MPLNHLTVRLGLWSVRCFSHSKFSGVASISKSVLVADEVAELWCSRVILFAMTSRLSALRVESDSA